MDAETDIRHLADPVGANAEQLERDFEWLAAVLERRLTTWFAEPNTSPILPDAALPPPEIRHHRSPYAALLEQHALTPIQRLILLLALAPHFRPQLFDVLMARNEVTQRAFTEFAGLTNSVGGFAPSNGTALFLLAGDNLGARMQYTRLFDADERFVQLDILLATSAAAGDPRWLAPLRVTPRVLTLLTRGFDAGTEFDEQFPARRITTGMRWDELVLPEATLSQLEEVKNWLTHGQTLLRDWDMGTRLRPGFTSLFSGPPGTGKTLSACLLGKLCDCEVYRIDLSMIVSKYIGETEKNLARVFDQAEHRRWILFFDEADALFGKRTQVSDAHDRYANQEVSFLLQRIDDFSGVVILASNFKTNIDDAFLRRFQSVIQFPMPRKQERLRLWREAFSVKATLDERLNLAQLAERYEVSGGTIMNVARYASLRALARDTQIIRADDVEEGVRREMLKEGRAV